MNLILREKSHKSTRREGPWLAGKVPCYPYLMQPRAAINADQHASGTPLGARPQEMFAESCGGSSCSAIHMQARASLIEWPTPQEALSVKRCLPPPPKHTPPNRRAIQYCTFDHHFVSRITERTERHSDSPSNGLALWPDVACYLCCSPTVWRKKNASLKLLDWMQSARSSPSGDFTPPSCMITFPMAWVASRIFDVVRYELDLRDRQSHLLQNILLPPQALRIVLLPGVVGISRPASLEEV